MKRREFFQATTIGALGLGLAAPHVSRVAKGDQWWQAKPQRSVKNIIFMVSDGMSAGTLQLAETFAHVRAGETTQWIDLYRERRIARGLMDMASANSWVTDSAAASSSWGGGVRVNNGSLNVGPAGEEHRPILQSSKRPAKQSVA